MRCSEEESSADLEGLELLVEAGDGGGEAVLADVADVPRHHRRRLRAGGRPRGGPLRLRLPLARGGAVLPLLLPLVLVLPFVLARRPAVVAPVGLPPHPTRLQKVRPAGGSLSGPPPVRRRRVAAPAKRTEGKQERKAGMVERICPLPACGGNQTKRI